MVEKILSVNSKLIVRWNCEIFNRKGMKCALGGSDGVCWSDTLVLSLVCNIVRLEGPSLGLLIDYTILTWVGNSLALIYGTKIGKPGGAYNG